MKIKEFKQSLDDAKIIAAIVEAERKSSGEICLFVEPKKVEDVMAAARETFLRLRLDKTKNRNAVLFYFVPASQEFAIVGDKAVYERAGDSFWSGAAGLMSKLMKKGEFTEAVVIGIRQVGNILEEFFPRDPNDQNEIPDEVIRG